MAAGRILRQRWPLVIVVAVLAVYLLSVLVFNIIGLGRISPPKAARVSEIVTLEQSWSGDDAAWFHHTSQGTKIMRYDWFMALEQPELDMVGTPRLLHESDYLQRYGFLPDESPNEYSNGLPIGFATEEGFQEPVGRLPKVAPYKVLGLTCAACHTGQINYKGQAIRIEGGPGLVDLGTFQAAVRRAIFFTKVVPFRFDRFAARVLKDDNTSEARNKLDEELSTLIEQGLEDERYAKRKHLYDLKAGPGRTDALGLIGNRAFADLSNKDNLAIADAPVNFPPLWNTPWFDWVQYDASIRPPMVRNIGEALGVGAIIITDKENGELYDSTVNLKNLHAMERRIAGPKPFAGLKSPAWPTEILGDLDPLRVGIGRTLFGQRCKHCHPLVEELQRTATNPQDPGRSWVPADTSAKPAEGMPYLIRLETCNLELIGTDPARALNVHKRVVFTPEGALSEGIALLRVTAGVRERKFRELLLTSKQQQEYDGFRNMPIKCNDEDAGLAVASNLGYRPRPLDGVWATAPYLHNGSVPSLYELLSPVAQRRRVFYVGSREFDPVRVGLDASGEAGRYLFDTSIPGNLNTGHEFRNLTLEEFERLRPTSHSAPNSQSEAKRWAVVLGLPYSEYRRQTLRDRERRITQATEAALPRARPKGVLGPAFTEEERWGLIEYLKSL